MWKLNILLCPACLIYWRTWRRNGIRSKLRLRKSRRKLNPLKFQILTSLHSTAKECKGTRKTRPEMDSPPLFTITSISKGMDLRLNKQPWDTTGKDNNLTQISTVKTSQSNSKDCWPSPWLTTMCSFCMSTKECLLKLMARLLSIITAVIWRKAGRRVNGETRLKVTPSNWTLVRCTHSRLDTGTVNIPSFWTRSRPSWNYSMPVTASLKCQSQITNSLVNWVSHSFRCMTITHNGLITPSSETMTRPFKIVNIT